MMWAAAWTVFSALCLAYAAPRFARQLQPPIATVLLASCAIASVVGGGYALAALAFTRLAQIPEVAAEGDWSPPLLRDADPIPTTIAIVSGLIVTFGVVAIAHAARHKFCAYWRLRQSVTSLGHAGGVLIIDSDRPDAFATPAAGGRIVITSGLLDALQPGEGRVVVAHERAHLRLRHNWWIVAADLAAAANPLLRPTATAVAESVERWADERAAAEVGDRLLAARALARAALHIYGSQPAATLAMVGGQMPRRVNALLQPPPRRRLAPAVVLLALVCAVTATTVNVGSRTDCVFDRAAVSTRH